MVFPIVFMCLFIAFTVVIYSEIIYPFLVAENIGVSLTGIAPTLMINGILHMYQFLLYAVLFHKLILFYFMKG